MYAFSSQLQGMWETAGMNTWSFLCKDALLGLRARARGAPSVTHQVMNLGSSSWRVLKIMLTRSMK
jgi:hypothetical protein